MLNELSSFYLYSRRALKTWRFSGVRDVIKWWKSIYLCEMAIYFFVLKTRDDQTDSNHDDVEAKKKRRLETKERMAR